ncbi:MAG: hypothetical protein CMJ43_03285 [Phyllobacteriaceae bacterium]|nr:hypothetical protein [Phyllobacteriaceae bacterium]
MHLATRTVGFLFQVRREWLGGRVIQKAHVPHYAAIVWFSAFGDLVCTNPEHDATLLHGYSFPAHTRRGKVPQLARRCIVIGCLLQDGRLLFKLYKAGLFQVFQQFGVLLIVGEKQIEIRFLSDRYPIDTELARILALVLGDQHALHVRAGTVRVACEGC